MVWGTGDVLEKEFLVDQHQISVIELVRLHLQRRRARRPIRYYRPFCPGKFVLEELDLERRTSMEDAPAVRTSSFRTMLPSMAERDGLICGARESRWHHGAG